MTPSQRHVLRFNPRRLFTGGVAGGFWDVSDRKTLFQDTAMTTPVAADGDLVGAIMDKSSNGNHLIQIGVDSTRPTYKTSGGLHWLEFDGVADHLSVSFTIAQPWERISAIRQISWTSTDRVYAGVAVNSGLLFQTGTTPNISLFSGGAVALSTLAVGADGVVMERHQGAASRVALNSGVYVTGNGGTTETDGLRVGCGSGVASVFGNVRFYGGFMRHGAMTDVQIGNARRYFATKAGVAL